MPILTPEEVQAALKKLPAVDHHGEQVEHTADGELRIRLPFKSAYVGSDVWSGGGEAVYSGPMVLGFADTALYALHCRYLRREGPRRYPNHDDEFSQACEDRGPDCSRAYRSPR